MSQNPTTSPDFRKSPDPGRRQTPWTRKTARKPDAPKPGSPSLLGDVRRFVADHRILALSVANSMAVLVLFCVFAVFLDGALRKRAHADVRERHERIDRKLLGVAARPDARWAPLQEDGAGAGGGAATGGSRRESPQRWAVPQPRSHRAAPTYPVEVRGSPAAGRTPSWPQVDAGLSSGGVSSGPQSPPGPPPEEPPEAFDPAWEAPPTPDPEMDIIIDPTER